MHKFEVHLHTKACSACARSTGEEMVDSALAAGYDGFVITNHFFHGNTAIDRTLPWKDFVFAYVQDYLEVKAYADKKGIQVFFGLEEVYAPGREMLIYGLDPNDLIEHPEFRDCSPKQRYAFIHSHGGLCFCAHPFRRREYIPDPGKIPDPDLFDGIEVFNLANPAQDNLEAFLFAANHRKVMLSGSDTHNFENFGHAGLDFDTPVKDYADLLNKMRNGEGRLINPYEI